MLTRKTVVLAKAEATYGTDPVPTVTANALLVSNLDFKVAGEEVKRDFYKSSLSQAQFVRGATSCEISFTTELRGTGTRGVIPAFGWEGALATACGMTETVTASTSVVWTPASSSLKSVTLYVYRDGILHKVLGCMGTAKFNFEVGKAPTATWSFKGLYETPTDASPAAQTFSIVVPNTVLSAGLTIGGYAAIAEKLEIDLGVDVGQRKSMNAPTGILGFQVTGRNPSGSFDPEAVTEATHTFWANWAAATAVALNIGPIGSTSGNIVTVTAPKLQYKDLSYGDRDGTLTYQVPFALAMNAGDDEVSISFT